MNSNITNFKANDEPEFFQDNSLWMQVSAAKLRLFVKETADSVGALSERKFYWHIGCDGMGLFDSVSSIKFVQIKAFFRLIGFRLECRIVYAIENKVDIW